LLAIAFSIYPGKLTGKNDYSQDQEQQPRSIFHYLESKKAKIQYIISYRDDISNTRAGHAVLIGQKHQVT
jgi:hypothetical protein